METDADLNREIAVMITLATEKLYERRITDAKLRRGIACETLWHLYLHTLPADPPPRIEEAQDMFGALVDDVLNPRRPEPEPEPEHSKHKKR